MGFSPKKNSATDFGVGFVLVTFALLAALACLGCADIDPLVSLIQAIRGN